MGEKSADDEDKEKTNGKGEKALSSVFQTYKEQGEMIFNLSKTIERLASRLQPTA